MKAVVRTMVIVIVIGNALNERIAVKPTKKLSKKPFIGFSQTETATAADNRAA
jgi:hypothetical protein